MYTMFLLITHNLHTQIFLCAQVRFDNEFVELRRIGRQFRGDEAVGAPCSHLMWRPFCAAVRYVAVCRWVSGIDHIIIFIAEPMDAWAATCRGHVRDVQSVANP